MNWRGRFFEIGWQKASRPLGFELELHDFARGLHAGSTQPRTFESHLWLRHETRHDELKAKWRAAAALTAPADGDPFIKIDMNHPLRLDGWRIFQARFAADPKAGTPETTILQVNRDPGLPLIYLASSLLVLALVIVFFQKPYLRALGQSLEQRGVSTTWRFLHALRVVVLCFLSTVPGLSVILWLPEGPGKGVGVLLITLGLVLESLVIHGILRRRVASILARQASPTIPLTSGAGHAA